MEQLPDFRRVVTGHNEDGKAIVQSDKAFTPQTIPSGDANFALLWTTQNVPANNNDQTDGALRDAGLTLTQGSVVRVVDMLPNAESPMHRTNSIDYGIVLEGEIEIELDNGDKQTVGANSIIVQRGTNHLWRNKSKTKICRIIFILIEASPYLHNGKPLDEQKPKGDK